MEKLSLAALVVVGGFVGGALGGSLFAPSSAPTESLLGQTPAQQVDLSGIESQLTAIQGDQAGFQAALKVLQGEVRSMQRRPVEASPTPSDVESGSAQPPFAALDSAVPYSPEEEARFATYLQRIEERKEEERQAQEEQRRQQRLDDRVARLAEQLALDPYQQSEMKRVLGESEQSMRDFFTEMRSSGGNMDRSSMRQAMEDLQTKTNQQLASFLNSDQLSQYQESNQGGFGRFFGGRSDRPQRDGGGPAGGGRGSGGGSGGGGGGGRNNGGF